MTGRLFGLTDPEGDAERISEIIKTRLDPIPEFNLSFCEEEGKRLIVLNIYKGEETPILLFRRWCDGSVYPCRE